MKAKTIKVSNFLDAQMPYQVIVHLAPFTLRLVIMVKRLKDDMNDHKTKPGSGGNGKIRKSPVIIFFYPPLIVACTKGGRRVEDQRAEELYFGSI